MRRIAVTGLGVLAPNGIGTQDFARGFWQGRNGVRRILAFDPAGFASQVAGALPEIDTRPPGPATAAARRHRHPDRRGYWQRVKYGSSGPGSRTAAWRTHGLMVRCAVSSLSRDLQRSVDPLVDLGLDQHGSDAVAPPHKATSSIPEAQFTWVSYGFRPKRSAIDACEPARISPNRCARTSRAGL
jgi:hypothetical protein